MVVNDLGGSMTGAGSDPGPASEVVARIAAAGGTAVADTSDLSSEAGARAVVARAVTTYGRVDIVIHNAGIMRWAGFPDVPTHDLEQHLAVHTAGAFHTSQAAWPHFVGQGYGRIVLTTSTGLLGLAQNTAYATAKAAVVGLARSLAVAGADHGIKVNLIAPAAMTRMAGPPPAEGDTSMAPDLVAPMAAFLAHEACPVSGELYVAGAGRFARLFLASTEGYRHDGEAPTIEDVAERWAVINDESGYAVPADLMAWSTRFLGHLDR